MRHDFGQELRRDQIAFLTKRLANFLIDTSQSSDNFSDSGIGKY
jgi:hypothetical protein